MRDIRELNINEGGRVVTRPKPTLADYKSLEAEYEIQVPEGLRSLLEHANGGHPELDSILPESSPCGERFGVSRFFHLLSGDQNPGSFDYALRHWRSILGAKALPFADDGGGNLFFLDWHDSPPTVKLCLHDANMKLILIAPTFDAFVDGLEMDPDMI